MALLTVDDLRAWPEFAETDASVLTLLLAAEEQAIERELGGPVGAVTEVVVGGGHTFLTTRRRILTVSSITTDVDEVVTTLAANDYRIAHDRRTLFRRGDGSNPAYLWSGYVTIAYEPENDETMRKRVQKELVALDLAYAPGSTSEQIGSWMEQQQRSSAWNASTERTAILATLWPTPEFDFA